jgi:cysteine desulfurase
VQGLLEGAERVRLATILNIRDGTVAALASVRLGHTVAASAMMSRTVSLCALRCGSAASTSRALSAAAAAAPTAAAVDVFRPIYLDMQATTPVDPRVSDAMMPYMIGGGYGNPHSRTHKYGWDAETAVETARGHIANLVGADPKEIIFTSGATESNNMAVKGVSMFYKARKNHVVTTQTEHKCVLDSCRWLEQRGFTVTYLPVGKDGLVDVEELKASLRHETALVSVMAVNNEIGVVQPLAEIGAACREAGVFFHTDAAQMVGKMPVDVNSMNIDVMSISGHKLYGPKGIGCLYVRRRPRVRIEPLFSGGGQERGLRSGTLATALTVGFGEAARIAGLEMERDTAHVTALSQRLYDGITSRIPEVTLNGHREKRYPGNLNLSFAHVEGESMLMALKNVAVSSGSACTSASLEPSYVLRALGVEDEMAHTSLRFGLGRFSTTEEIDYAIELAAKHVARLREMSPLWEMSQEGIDIKSISWSSH